MLTRLFIQILNMSLTGALMILAVLALRLLLRRAPRIFSYGLWAVVLFRLLCPVSFESGFSLLGMLHAPAAESGSVEYISQESGMTAAAPKNGSVASAAGEQGPAPGAGTDKTERKGDTKAAFGNGHFSRNAWQLFLYAGSRIWLAGALGLLLYGAAGLCAAFPPSAQSGESGWRG